MPRLAKFAAFGFLALLVNTAYVSAYASATIFYMTNVLLHLVLGIFVSLALGCLLIRDAGLRRQLAVPAVFFFLSLGFALYIVGRGNLRSHRWELWSHIALASLAVAALLPYLWRQSQISVAWLRFRQALLFSVALLVLWPASAALYHKMFPNPDGHVLNPLAAPAAMTDEGGGPQSPFFPSSAKTNVGGIIPSNFFMDSETCAECHKEIYEQWNSSAHHFASFNNQFYRKSVEYMQDVVGTQPSKWCAGCHDHAVFFNGRFDRPIKEQIDTPEAHAGLACTSCHAIVHVEGSMGNGGFTIDYPPLHQLATSKNKYIRALHNFITYLDPQPHRQTFMKPFMRQNAAEFCSACHKVHLDVPVNQYRWFRGFNEYDAWQASGVSQEGARSFYYPDKSSTCVDCHMPLVPSQQPGNVAGQIHSHSFPAANMAVPYANHDQQQMSLTERFLKSGFITVDIFAAAPEEAQGGGTAMLRRGLEQGPQSMSSFAVGEEAEAPKEVLIRKVGKVAAPLDEAGVKFQPGSTVRVDVVVRTRKIGHFFPGGTVDAFDVWLELKGEDADGKVIFWSGKVEGGNGAIERGAHFYRSYQLDADGNMIDKRNAWQTRSVLYVRLIPPGAADVAHYRVRIPRGARRPIILTAKLNYRKFSYYYTQFAYAGQPKPNQDPSLIGPDHNSLEYTFDRANIPRNVSGEIKDDIPVLPIVTVAQAQTKLDLNTSQSRNRKQAGSAEGAWKIVVDRQDRERWNDWGIGLLLQGDLKEAEYAFERVTEAEPEYADGWLNVARALIEEGENEAAKPYIQRALAINPKLGRVYYFKALIEKADGDYNQALDSLRTASAMYPRDRVVLNQIARILFLKREYAAALQALNRVGLIDPEDVQMHYTAMLCYRGLGEQDNAAREEKLFRRFKADEAAQAVTAKPRMLSPEDNNERQQIHEHESVPLNDVVSRTASSASNMQNGR